MHLLSSLLLVLLLVPTARATTYYVAKTGDDGNDGLSVGNAWLTVWKACQSPVSAGDTVLIRAGTYDTTGAASMSGGPHRYVMSPRSGSSGSPVVYKGYPGDALPRIHGDTTAVSPYLGCVGMLGKSWVVFDSIEFTHGFGAGMYLESTSNLTVKNCVFDSIGFQQSHGNNPGAITSGLHTANISNLLVENCEIFDTYEHAIHLYDTDSAVIKDNVFHDCPILISLKAGLQATWGVDSNIHIYDNVLYRTSGSRYGSTAIWTMTGHGKYYHIHHNVIYGPFSSYLFWFCADTNGDGDEWDMDHWWIYNNTVDMSTYGGILLNCVQTNDGTNFLDYVYIYNNIFYAPRGSYGPLINLGKKTVVLTAASGNTGDSLFWDYNLTRDTTSGLGDYFTWAELGWGSGNRWTLAEFRTNTHNADNDTIIDTGDLTLSNTDIFVDRAARDYHILGSSPAAGIGVNATIGGVSMPSYVGAFAPSDTTCPAVTLVLPTDGDTIEAHTVTLEANFTTDGAGDTVIVTVKGGYVNPPTGTVYTDTLAADSTGWTWDWGSLTEDSTYYWRIIATDTSCADTSAIRSFLVDSIPSTGAGKSVKGIRSVQGLRKLGVLEEEDGGRRYSTVDATAFGVPAGSDSTTFDSSWGIGLARTSRMVRYADQSPGSWHGDLEGTLFSTLIRKESQAGPQHFRAFLCSPSLVNQVFPDPGIIGEVMR